MGGVDTSSNTQGGDGGRWRERARVVKSPLCIEMVLGRSRCAKLVGIVAVESNDMERRRVGCLDSRTWSGPLSTAITKTMDEMGGFSAKSLRSNTGGKFLGTGRCGLCRELHKCSGIV